MAAVPAVVTEGACVTGSRADSGTTEPGGYRDL